MEGLYNLYDDLEEMKIPVAKVELVRDAMQSDETRLVAVSYTHLDVYKRQIKYGVIVVSTLPIICVYPFLQKYFVKGVMIGSIKG